MVQFLQSCNFHSGLINCFPVHINYLLLWFSFLGFFWSLCSKLVNLLFKAIKYLILFLVFHLPLLSMDGWMDPHSVEYCCILYFLLLLYLLYSKIHYFNHIRRLKRSFGITVLRLFSETAWAINDTCDLITRQQIILVSSSCCLLGGFHRTGPEWSLHLCLVYGVCYHSSENPSASYLWQEMHIIKGL